MKKKVALVLLIIILLTLGISTISFGINTGLFKPDVNNTSDLAKKFGGVIGIIQLVGTLVAVIACIVLGIKYILSSVEEKAEIKKKLIPLVIGTCIFFGSTTILRIIGQIAGWFE